MQEHKPLYLYSREEALRHGERDQWRDSYRENCDCARAIERAIAENYRDNCLGNCAGSILDRYGFTRVNWVLANTMQQKSYDGRFSEGNKRWAKQFYIPNDDIRWHFTVESHPGLTNLFVEQVRDAWQSLGLFDASHCLPDDSDQDYTGKVVVIDPNILKDKYKTLEDQLFLAEGGFGASPNSRGRKVYLSPKGVEHLRSSLAKEIFAQDLFSVYEKQTEHRNELRMQSKELIAGIVAKINGGTYDNPVLEQKLSQLAEKLSRTSGKKVYGYLKADVKDLVDSIVDEVASDRRIAVLYDLWYEQREEVIRTYTENLPERVPLSQNNEFKSVRNAVIQEAMGIVLNREQSDLPDDSDLPEPDPTAEETESAEQPTEKKKDASMWSFYRQAKEMLDQDSEDYDPNRAVELLIRAANMGCGVAKYRLGKMFLRGDEVPQNVDYALRWLEESVSEGNQYAEYLLGKTLLRGELDDQDTERGENLLRRSAAQGNRYACYTLGKALLDGSLLPQNVEEAIRLLQTSAEKGFPNAQYLIGKLLCQGELMTKDVEKAIAYLESASAAGNPFAAYLAGKIRFTEDDVKDVLRAIENFETAAKEGNDYAEYQLGRLYLYGRDVEQDYEKAMEYLHASADHGNVYAQQLLHSIRSGRNWSAAMGSLRLLQHISRIIQNRLEDERKGRIHAIDHKLKRKIDEKKQAHGIRQ